MWFYVQLWLPLLPIAYVVSCAVDQQTKPHVWWPPDQKFFRVTSAPLRPAQGAANRVAVFGGSWALPSWIARKCRRMLSPERPR